MFGFGVPRKELINGILLTKHLKYYSKNEKSSYSHDLYVN